LDSFSYLSEDKEALENLYYVCLNNNVIHIKIDEDSIDDAESPEDVIYVVNDSNEFENLYPEFDDFKKLFT